MSSSSLEDIRKNLPEWTQEPGKVAIIHDWMTGMRGGEAILEAICELFPAADLHTLLWTDKEMSPTILNGRKVFTSPLQSLMGIGSFRRGYRKLLPLFPWAAERLSVEPYQLVLSNTHCVAKGVRVSPNSVHVAYVSTPMRYVWDMFDQYFNTEQTDMFTRNFAGLIRKPLQRWDVQSTNRVDALIANSRFVQKRIQEYWHRSSTVVHPYVYTDRFNYVGDEAEPGKYYLIVSAFAPYKKIDLAVEAFRKLGLPLKIIGGGQEEKRLRRLAGGNIEFLGKVSNEEVAHHYANCRAFVFPGLEDFGITPLEAMCSGRPVIAYGEGGALDTVTEQTGVLFPKQSVSSLVAAVEDFENRIQHFSPRACHDRAMAFSREIFMQKYIAVVEQAIAEKKGISEKSQAAVACSENSSSS